MHKFICALVLSPLALSANAAAERVGAIGDMAGTVTVGGHGAVAKAIYGTPLLEGSTVMVSSDGRAKIKLVNGCDIILRGSQYVTINSKLGCNELQASAQQLMATYRVAQVGGTTALGGGATGSTAVLGPVLGFGLVAGVATADRIANETGPVSGQ